MNEKVKLTKRISLAKVAMTNPTREAATDQPGGLGELLARVEVATGADRELDAAVALALGWQQRKVTSLGLNGRTPGSIRWFNVGHPFYNPNGSRYIGSARPPNFTGPRGKARAIALLRSAIKKATGHD